MHNDFKSFKELEDELLQKFEARGCTPVTVTGYRYLCNSIFSWLKSNNYSCYTKIGGDSFLEDYQKRHGCIPYYFNLRKTI